MECVKFIFPGEPIAWKRPAGSLHRYDAQKKEKQWVQYQIKSALTRFSYSLFPCALKVKFSFYLPVPPSDSQTEKSSKWWGLTLAYKKPDIDNLQKFYLDCGTGFLWQDDDQITDIVSKKRYSDNPRTELLIMPASYCSLPSSTRAILRILPPHKLKEFAAHVKKLSYLDEGKINQNLEEDETSERRKWLAWTALLLSDFAKAHADDFKKIEKVDVDLSEYEELKGILDESRLQKND
jgi:Holliday junction resolvase RusA-like endonuclease